MHWPRIILVTMIGLIVLAAAVSPSVYFYRKYKEMERSAQSGGARSDEQDQKIMAEVGSFMDLPVGETPSVVTIDNVEQLKDQPFFANAKNGNVLLIYNTAKKAILYDPARKKVVEVGPVFTPTGSPAPSVQSSGSVTPVPSSQPAAARTPAPKNATESASPAVGSGTTLTPILSPAE